MSLSLRTYFFAGLIVLLGIFGQWWGGILYDLWRFPAAMLILAIFLEGLLIRRQDLFLHREIGPKLPLGQPTTGNASVRNPAPYPLRLETQPRYPDTLTGSEAVVHWTVSPGATTHKPFTVTPVQLGPTSPGPLYVRMRGRLGLAWWPKRRQAEAPGLEVVPRALSHTEPGTGSEKGGDKQRARRAGTGGELLSLRDYQPDDPLHAIDWKATARRQRPTVRVYAEEQHLELVLVLDAGRGSQYQAGPLTRLHHYVNVAARLAELAARRGDRVGLVAFADQPFDAVALDSGVRCLGTIRRHLKALRSRQRESNPLAAVLYLRRMLQHRGLVVFLTEIEEKETATQLVKATQLLTPKHTPLIASLVDEQIDAWRRQAAQRWLDPYLSYAASEYTQSVRNTVLHLQRLGASVVLEKPERLDPAVLARYRSLRERRRV